MNRWSVRQMQGKPNTKKLNKTSALIPIGTPAV